ncbi:hypothetical protein L2D08_02735 [Domibacillus sp. PGB-M46]|uniref:hypothetical protein n=1 Tax=Domibacillus sp. PGB-M46 TaxID=2910255 RepID=UPI001F5716F9|nr:hypothetical protein [Domibacillus sp. PGB-M46]MCI2253279.1 hypothetical protein [Domibacillus sp. PGB-M46]
MTAEEAAGYIESLRNGTVARVHIERNEFLSFRQVLIQQADFKHFRGIAKHGGHTEYEYMKAPRS